MIAKRRKRLLIILSAILAFALARLTAGPPWVEGLFYDSALAVRAAMGGEAPPESGVLVVGLDEASLALPDLEARPRALFSPVWAESIAALRSAGARVIVLDFILAFSGDKIAPGYDREFLRTLYANRGRVVLGRSQNQLPARSYSAALGMAPMSLGLSEIMPDADGVFRHVPLLLDGGDAPALGGAALSLAGIRVFPDKVRLAPRAPVDALPTMPLGQVLACAKTDPAALAKAAGGKIVFIGTTLPEEDRKLSPSRFFIAGASENTAPGCNPATISSGTASIAGVYLHALAVDQVLGNHLLRDLNIWLVALMAACAAALAVSAALEARPWAALCMIAGLCLALWLGEMAGIGIGVYAPMGYSSLLSLGFGAGGFVFRFLFEERHRMRMQLAFGHYLAPEIVRRLSESDAMPALGGEQRDASVMFADLSGFTALSSRLPAGEVVALTNQYLGLMAEEIEASGGYIDKYIGDAVMAVWGAPLADPGHARHAVLCAQRIAHRIRQKYDEAKQRGEDGFSVKIGVNSGPIIAGNVGAQNRLNYTAVGDTVNVAARLESVPGDYGCLVVIGEQTAAQLGGEFVLRELDRIAVKGRANPLSVFEPLDQTAASEIIVERYSLALVLYRRRDFAAAADIWDGLAEQGDPPASVMAARARTLIAAPPPPDWDGVWHKREK